MKLTKNRIFLDISIEGLTTYLYLFAANSLLLFTSNYPNLLLLGKYIGNILYTSKLPTNSEELTSVIVNSWLFGIQLTICIIYITQLVKRLDTNYKTHNNYKNLGIFIGTATYLFLPTTNGYIIVTLFILLLYYRSRLNKLNNEKLNEIIGIIDKIIEEKEAEEENQK